jgi:hypothetical protein
MPLSKREKQRKAERVQQVIRWAEPTPTCDPAGEARIDRGSPESRQGIPPLETRAGTPGVA